MSYYWLLFSVSAATYILNSYNGCELLIRHVHPLGRSDLSREANVLAESALLPPSSTKAKPKSRLTPSQADEKGSWTKGFLTTTGDKPLRGCASPKVQYSCC